MQGDILRRAEKHFEEFKDTSLPLPIWYQDGLTKQWKSGKLILQGKGYACISVDGSNKINWLPLRKILPGEPLACKIENKNKNKKTTNRQNPQEEKISIQAMEALKISKEHCPQCHQPHDLPTWGQTKTPS